METFLPLCFASINQLHAQHSVSSLCLNDLHDMQLISIILFFLWLISKRGLYSLCVIHCTYHDCRVAVVELWSSLHQSLAMFVDYWLDHLHSLAVLCGLGAGNIER